MSINALSLGGQSAAGAEQAAKTPKDEFLRLLVAQLENQNPLQPQDSAQFVAQLAQFAQVEQSAETNTRLQGLEAAETAGLRASFANIVGREVTAKTDKIALVDGELPDAAYHVNLKGASSNVVVTVRDAAGNEVDRIELGPRGEGEIALAWDGVGKEGVKLPDGEYTLEVHAEGIEEDQKVDADIRVRGVAQSLDFEDGVIKFDIGSVEITPADILAIEA